MTDNLIATLRNAARAARVASTPNGVIRNVDILLCEDGLIIRGRDSSRPKAEVRAGLEAAWIDVERNPAILTDAIRRIVEALDRALNA